MPSLRAGITQASADPGLTFPVNTFETDWTDLSLPAGWSSDPDATASPTYSATGTYGTAGTPGDAQRFLFPFTEQGLHSYTMISEVQFIGVDDGLLNFELNGGATENSLAAVVSNTTDPVTAVESYNDIMFVAHALPVNSPGPVFWAFTYASNGAYAAYTLETGETTIVDGTGTDTPISVLVDSLRVVSMDADPAYLNPGTAGAYRIKHTYVKTNDVLNQAAIEAVCATWGWS